MSSAAAPRSVSNSAQKLYQRLSGLARIWISLPFVRFDLQGVENIPSEGRFIVASNHAARLYAFVPMMIIGRNPAVLVAEAVWLCLPVAFFLWRLGGIPVLRFSRKGRAAAKREAIRVLLWDGIVIVFPEGKHSKRGVIGRFRPGAARMALAAQAPVVPIGIYLRWTWRRRIVRVSVGVPLSPADYGGKTADMEVLADLRRSISNLSGLPLQEEL